MSECVVCQGTGLAYFGADADSEYEVCAHCGGSGECDCDQCREADLYWSE